MQRIVYRGPREYQWVFLAMLRIWRAELVYRARRYYVPTQDFLSERAWLAQSLRCDEGSIGLQLIAGDASPRKFYRVSLCLNGEMQTHILMVSPPTENNEKFVLVQGLLKAAGVRVPRLQRADLSLGLFLLEDLGDVTYWSALQEGDVDTYYTRALIALSDMQALSGARTLLPLYDDKELQRELTICPEWFFARALSMDLGPAGEAIFERFSQFLLSVAAEQPSRFVHRDYHSRNLMVLDKGEIAIIDFQDAIIGPITYDAVSLLKDVYIVWPREQQISWLAQYWQLLVSAGYLPDDSWGAFVRWYDLMGLQRHVKILGVFSRLWLRDQKPAYMRDIPVVIDYIREACGLYSKDYSAIADFWKWFEDTVLPRVQQADWYATS